MKNHEGFCVLHILNPLVQRQDIAEKKHQIKLDIPRVGLEGGRVPPEVESAIQRARGDGQPLEDELKEQMSTSLGQDFSEVRVHTGHKADGLNRLLRARAFTVGPDIFFAQGAYEPDTLGGRELIAHELVHVVQQGHARDSVGVTGMTLSPAGDALEREAEAIASLAVARPSCRNYNRIAIRLKTKLSAIVQRSLAERCEVSPPIATSCHVTTLWWIYQELEAKKGRDAGWGSFQKRASDASQKIADLIKDKGGKGTKNAIGVNSGTVVVFSEGILLKDVQAGHSCVCGSDLMLHGSSQAGFFTDCEHGKVGIVCKHSVSSISCEQKIYTVNEANAISWAEKNL